MEYYVRQTCGRAGGRSHRISPPSFCDACLNIYPENDSAVLVLFQLASAKTANRLADGPHVLCANIPKKHSRHTIVFWGYVWVVNTFNRVWIDQVWWMPIPLEGTCTRNIFSLSSPFALANLVSESINDWGGYADSVPVEVTKKQNFRR